MYHEYLLAKQAVKSTIAIYQSQHLQSSSEQLFKACCCVGKQFLLTQHLYGRSKIAICSWKICSCCVVANDSRLTALLQVCNLPPAWGYVHQGLGRFILSSPASCREVSKLGSRLIKLEDDSALLRKAKQREDRMASLIAFQKLGKGIGVSCCSFASGFCHLC